MKTEATNYLGDKEYRSYDSWKAAIKKSNPGAKFVGDKDIGSAQINGQDVGEWDGEKGSVYSNTTEALIKRVSSGKLTAEAAVAGTVLHDPRWAQNYPYAPVIHQDGSVPTHHEDMDSDSDALELGAIPDDELSDDSSSNSMELDVSESHDMAHDDEATINYPLAGATRWPRGSHESRPQSGDAPQYLNSEGSQYRQDEIDGALEMLINGDITIDGMMGESDDNDEPDEDDIINDDDDELDTDEDALKDDKT